MCDIDGGQVKTIYRHVLNMSIETDGVLEAIRKIDDSGDLCHVGRAISKTAIDQISLGSSYLAKWLAQHGKFDEMEEVRKEVLATAPTEIREKIAKMRAGFEN